MNQPKTKREAEQMVRDAVQGEARKRNMHGSSEFSFMTRLRALGDANAYRDAATRLRALLPSLPE